MEKIELTEEELYKKKIKDEFERLKNLPQEEIVLTEEQIQAEIIAMEKDKRIAEINKRLNDLDDDFRQVDLGAIIPDIEERKAEFITLHNELRQLLGKPAREYKN
jgi:hypothetical protein